MRTYTLWIEGYAATGEHGTAQCLGSYQAPNFNAAVQEWYDDKGHTGNWGSVHYNFNKNEWSAWGCTIYDNEADARKSFG